MIYHTYQLIHLFSFIINLYVHYKFMINVQNHFQLILIYYLITILKLF